MRTASLDTFVRQLTARDIPWAMNLSTLANWNQTAADWSLLLKLHAEGCLAIECNGAVVATATLICYRDTLAWLGMVLTHPAYRKRGFARQLVESALRIAEAKKIRCVKLDATDQGLSLYASLGFRREQQIERWSGPGGTITNTQPDFSAEMPDFELDREAFGADRGEALELLAAHALAFVTKDGFAMSRPGASASYLGPCVSRSPASAKLLIERALSAGGRQWYWDLFPSNRYAIKIAQDLGFKMARTLVRMVKGPDVRGSESMIYAGGGFELG